MATRNDTNEQITNTANAGRKAADEAARATRTGIDQTAQAGEQTLRAGTDIARRGAETVRDTMQAGFEAAQQNFQRITDQFTQVVGFAGPQSEEVSRRSTQNLQAVTQASTVLARGAQEVSQELFGLFQGQLQRNLDGLNRIASSRSVQDAIAVQSELVRDNLQQVIDTNRRVAELSVRVSDEAARVIQAQANSNANQARRAA
jgi:phasin family protein